MKRWIKSGSPWIWLTSGAVSLSLLSVLGLLCLIAWRGLIYFWPAPVYQWQLQDPQGQPYTVIGERYEREQVSAEVLADAGLTFAQQGQGVERMLVKTGNREYVPLDFRWVWLPHVLSETTPGSVAVIERRNNGNFYGDIVQLQYNGNHYQGDAILPWLETAVDEAQTLNAQASALQRDDIGRINFQLEKLRLQQRKQVLDGTDSAAALAQIEQQQQALQRQYQQQEQQLLQYRQLATRDQLLVQDMRGEQVVIPLAQVVQVHFPNRMSWYQKLNHWLHGVWRFVSEEPREANTEGGVYPAIFGTVFMVLLMAVIVTPFGVLAAVYLHEYAGKGLLTRVIRIAVINLAGVPSIVYGVFGLGFFVYVVGGSLDQLFYAEALPSPTFGTPGVLWSALTLAILTLPVVIVSTEEGLARIPHSVRHGSLALGATKAETLWRLVLPMASPAIMTGLILAVARAAGEVAPLMLVGVVKLAPQLPMDGNFPFVHLERKFMHLGFHIYDVGFQSPNVEATRPLVYATAFLLVSVIVALNLTAIGVRNHLRERYRHLDH
ncbi:phosphate ABC transporter permease PstA [uncultured Ferrimonas sp.]|uniref:phosphate ABC transporter permease PstA n=1 Tax=uncultured Ferrimonas sp. TaxID=432640 RepID=UPI002612AE9D|nr:phosphate ABC transporter permease PstA [uncultured Ferrimonas sp.]